MPEGIGDRTVLVIDPILATGESASAAISRLKGEGDTKIKLLSCLVLEMPEPEHMEQNSDLTSLLFLDYVKMIIFKLF